MDTPSYCSISGALNTEASPSKFFSTSSPRLSCSQGRRIRSEPSAPRGLQVAALQHSSHTLGTSDCTLLSAFASRCIFRSSISVPFSLTRLTTVSASVPGLLIGEDPDNLRPQSCTSPESTFGPHSLCTSHEYSSAIIAASGALRLMRRVIVAAVDCWKK